MERYDLSDLMKLGLRRFFWFFIPFTVILIIAMVILGLVPSRYHSKALLIVESQQISEDLVPSAIRAYAEDRLETIKASLRSRENILELSDRFGLIDSSSDVPFSERVERVRDDIRISINRVNDRRARRDGAGTITFEIGFVHENPQTAFRVANQLVTDFLSQNVEARIEAAEDTAAFMREEERDLRRLIADLQSQIADVRRQNPGASPESLAFNQDAVRRLEQQIEGTEQRIDESTQSLELLRMQQPLIVEASERNDLDRTELREKRREYTALSRRYTDYHPDMLVLQDEILALEERLEPEAFVDRAGRLIEDIGERLAEADLDDRETEELRARRADLEQRIVTAEQVGAERSLPELEFEAREAAILNRLSGLNERLAQLREDLAEAEARLEQTPAIAAQLSTLIAEEERLQRQLSQTQAQRAQAERTESLEEQQKAARVLILAPPVPPDVPTSPDKPRAAVLLAGLAGGLAGALGFAPVVLAPRIDTKRQLSQVLPGVAVIEVPEIVDAEEQKFRRNVMIGLVIASVFLTLVLVAVSYVVLVR